MYSISCTEVSFEDNISLNSMFANLKTFFFTVMDVKMLKIIIWTVLKRIGQFLNFFGFLFSECGHRASSSH